MRKLLIVVALVALVAASCSSGGTEDSSSSTTDRSAVESATDSTAPDATAPPLVFEACSSTAAPVTPSDSTTTTTAVPSPDDVQAAVLTAASLLPTEGTVCATGTGEPECETWYWPWSSDRYPNPPFTATDCNYWYVSVDSTYWTDLAPIIIDAYPYATPNENTNGPHITLAEKYVNSVHTNNNDNVSLTVTDDALDGEAAAEAVADWLDGTAGNYFPRSSPTPVYPVQGSTEWSGSDGDCASVWTHDGTSGKDGVSVATLPVVDGTAFWCTFTIELPTPGADDDSTVSVDLYPQVTLKGPAANGAVEARFSLSQLMQESYGDRKIPVLPGADTVGADNGGSVPVLPWESLTLPVWTPETLAAETVDYAIPTTCADPDGGEVSCLHLWGSTYDDAATCSYWFTLEFESDAIVDLLAEYGLGHETLHVSIARVHQTADDPSEENCAAAAALQAEWDGTAGPPIEVLEAQAEGANGLPYTDPALEEQDEAE